MDKAELIIRIYCREIDTTFLQCVLKITESGFQSGYLYLIPSVECYQQAYISYYKSKLLFFQVEKNQVSTNKLSNSWSNIVAIHNSTLTTMYSRNFFLDCTSVRRFSEDSGIFINYNIYCKPGISLHSSLSLLPTLSPLSCFRFVRKSVAFEEARARSTSSAVALGLA